MEAWSSKCYSFGVSLSPRLLPTVKHQQISRTIYSYPKKCMNYRVNSVLKIHDTKQWAITEPRVRQVISTVWIDGDLFLKLHFIRNLSKQWRNVSRWSTVDANGRYLIAVESYSGRIRYVLPVVRFASILQHKTTYLQRQCSVSLTSPVKICWTECIYSVGWATGTASDQQKHHPVIPQWFAIGGSYPTWGYSSKESQLKKN